PAGTVSGASSGRHPLYRSGLGPRGDSLCHTTATGGGGMQNAWPVEELILSHFAFEGFRTVMPALRLRSGQAPAGIQGEQAAACGYSAWIPAFAGMTQHSSTPHNHHDRLLIPLTLAFNSHQSA